MYKLPLKIPQGTKIVVTQGFCPIDNPSHDAVDYVVNKVGNSYIENCRLSYGIPFVCPVKEAKVVLINDFGTMNPLGNGIDLEWKENEYYYRIHCWHTVYNENNLGDIVKEGEVFALMGNTGDCRPMPTAETPFDGTHLHMRFSRYKKDTWGGNIEITSLDPRLYFDTNSPYYGEDLSNTTTDLIPLKWAWNKLNLKTNIEKLIYMFTHIFK